MTKPELDAILDAIRESGLQPLAARIAALEDQLALLELTQRLAAPDLGGDSHAG